MFGIGRGNKEGAVVGEQSFLSNLRANVLAAFYNYSRVVTYWGGDGWRGASSMGYSVGPCAHKRFGGWSERTMEGNLVLGRPRPLGV